VRGIGRQPPTQLVGRWSRRRSSDQPSVSARTDVRQKLPGSRPPVSSLSAAIPYATSRRTAVPGSVTLVSRVDVVPCKAATDLAKGRAWPDTEEVTGSNPVAPTTCCRYGSRTASRRGCCAPRSTWTWSAFPREQAKARLLNEVKRGRRKPPTEEAAIVSGDHPVEHALLERGCSAPTARNGHRLRSSCHREVALTGQCSVANHDRDRPIGGIRGHRDPDLGVRLRDHRRGHA